MSYIEIFENVKRIITKDSGPFRRTDFTSLFAALCFLEKGSGAPNLKKTATKMIKESGISDKDLLKAKTFVQSVDDAEFVLFIKYGVNNLRMSFFDETSSQEIIDIAIRLLNIKEGDIILDAGCSYGLFIANAALSNTDLGNKVQYTGIDVLEPAIRTGEMLLDCMKLNNVSLNVCNYLSDEIPDYNKAFIFPPLGYKQNNETRSQLNPSIRFTGRTVWMYIDRIIAAMPENGRVVAVVNDGALFGIADDEYRKELLKRGLIEGVIGLPSGMLKTASVKLSLVVLSKRNSLVKAITAEDLDAGINGKLSYNVQTVQEVCKRYFSADAPTFTNQVLLSKRILTPISLLALNEEVVQDGVPLKEVATVFSGAQYTIAKFKESISEQPTERRIITSSDIENGMVDWDALPFIEWNEKFDKYSVQRGDLIITSKSSKVKVAVVDIDPTEKIIVTGSMLIVRPTDRLNSMYLKIFLDSERGRQFFKAIQKGSYILSMSAKDLSDAKVPLPDLETQNRMAQKYEGYLSTLYALKEQVREIERKMDSFYETEVCD